MFIQSLRKEVMPEERTQRFTSMLFKKGDKNYLNNYRPISLLLKTYKIFTKKTQQPAKK